MPAAFGSCVGGHRESTTMIRYACSLSTIFRWGVRGSETAHNRGHFAWGSAGSGDPRTTVRRKAQAMGHGVYSVAHCPAILFPDCLAATDIDRLTDCVECLVGVGAQRRNGCNAHHDDQGQHYGILNGRRAVFGFDKIERELCELVH